MLLKPLNIQDPCNFLIPSMNPRSGKLRKTPEKKSKVLQTIKEKC